MRRLLLLCVLLTLAACAGGGRMAYGPGRTDYPVPGPPGDPWRPYIREASNRFSVPQQWIRAVMRQESGGHEYRYGRPIISSAGAMGLMQLMPDTYADMQIQNGLGNDPFEPHDNILAGTAYIRLMYGRYGAPAFLAAYNAGPQRLDDYLATGRSLPNETVNYVASIAPSLGTEIAMTGPLSAYAGAGPAGYAPVRPRRSYAAPIRLAAYHVPARSVRPGCIQDPDAAYDPDTPCRPPPVRASYIAAPVTRTPAFAAPAYGTPAYAPPVAQPIAPATYEAPAYRVAASGAWAIQVGAYTSAGQAHFATTMARDAAYSELAGSQILVQPTSRLGGAVLYRARLTGLARADASAACSTLAQHSMPCMIVAPGS
jgi:D-alanyl-D-alanine carboxypeptidase